MAFKRRKPVLTVKYRPQMPAELARSYTPPDIADPQATDPPQVHAAWEEAHRSAYQAFESARAEWLKSVEHLPVDPEQVTAPDSPFCGEVGGHQCVHGSGCEGHR